jgi:hypothetical protein
MAEGIHEDRDSILPVVRTRRVEVIDAHDRVRIVVGEIENVGPYDLPRFGLRLLGPDGGTRAEVTEDAHGVELTVIASENEVLKLGADDPRTLVADDGHHPSYMPAGQYSEVSEPGAYLILCDLDGGPRLSWRIGEDRTVEHDDA